jgi:RNA polymerase sigma-70 factor (ECF subfamily)
MNAPETLEDLLAQVALGNRTAFRLLYGRSSAKLFGVCLRILRDRTEAEDALQDIYIKVWEKAENFQAGKASAITWLVTIARNASIDRLRRRASLPRTVEEAVDVADNAPSPESETATSHSFRRLKSCMESLDPRHAHALRGVYLGGHTYREAADALDIPVNTAKTWIRRSLLSLRECMDR